MYRADAKRRRSPSAAAGYTFLEIVIVLGILSTMALITEKAMLSTAKTQRYLAAVRKVTERGHNLSYKIRERVTSSRRLFFADKVGQDYLDALDLDRAPPVSWARLPKISETGTLEPDAPGTELTGNVMLFVSEADATPAVSDPAKQTIRYIDTYQFNCIYPSLTDHHVIVEENMLPAYDLVLWESEPLPDFAQIMAISDDTERSNVIDDLIATHGYAMAWDPTGSVGSSLYDLTDLRSASPTPKATPTILEDEGRSPGGRLVYANTQLARADIDEKRRRPIFATDAPNTWLPHGFEVKIIGPSGGRQVWFHVVIEAQSGMGEVAVHGSTLVVNAKDL